MPGMMNTVLNLGLNDASVKALAQRGGERFALDCYRRLLDMFGAKQFDALHISSEFSATLTEFFEIFVYHML